MAKTKKEEVTHDEPEALTLEEQRDRLEAQLKVLKLRLSPATTFAQRVLHAPEDCLVSLVRTRDRTEKKELVGINFEFVIMIPVRDEDREPDPNPEYEDEVGTRWTVAGAERLDAIGKAISPGFGLQPYPLSGKEWSKRLYSWDVWNGVIRAEYIAYLPLTP